MSDRRVLAFGLLLLVDFVLSAVMLATDKNLQTDFGIVSAYYLHWYGVLAMGVLDLLVGLTLIGYSSAPMLKKMAPATRRGVAIGALLWTVIAILAMVGIVTTYSQVGFKSMNDFAQYLFGVTPYHNALSYIPWLYDLLLAMYLVTAVVGGLAVGRAPTKPTSPAAN